MVHFVGAGSGAADLITLRGKKISGGSGCCDLCRIPGQSAASRIYKRKL